MKKVLIVITILLIVLCASLYLYTKYPFPISGITRNIGETISPDGKYKEVTYTLERHPYGLFYHDVMIFSEVYNVKTGRRLGTSPVYEMIYSHETFWPRPDNPYVSFAIGIEIPVPVE